jgi:DNA-3-methyladenine glycosylase II
LRGVVEVEVRPPWPYRLPRRHGSDGVTRRRGAVITRLLHVDERPVVVHVWQPSTDLVRFRAAAAAEGELAASTEQVELAIERMRFAVSVDEDLGAFYDAFRCDPLIGSVIRRRPWHRTRRRPWPWEALAWAVTEQLIEVSRAVEIQKRVVWRWGGKLMPDGRAWLGRGPLRDVPGPDVIAGVAPAELAAFDLAPSRAIALIKCAREVASGRVDPAKPEGDRRLARISGIGPWTLQVLGFHGRGEPDTLPAGDLAYVKLVGMLAGLGRRATVEEVEEYFAPYAPFRGLAGTFALARWHGAVGQGPPLPLAA